MIFTTNNWTKGLYNEYLTYLNNNSEENYKKFQQRLIPTRYNILGVRMPVLRKIAQQIVKGDYQSFIKLNTYKTFEEVMIHGLVISYLEDLDAVEFHLKQYLSYIDNWSLTDSMSVSFKIFKVQQIDGLKLINKLLQSSDPFTIRLGLVLLLNYYVNDNYINEVIQTIKQVKNKHYYVMMANAWLTCECFVKYPNITEQLLKDMTDVTTKKKAISKINDSFRVEKSVKKKLSNLI